MQLAEKQVFVDLMRDYEILEICRTGKIIEKKSKRGRVFYGCDNYPKCDFVSWDAPSDKTCPVCGKVLLKKKDKAQTLYCVTPGCTYTFDKDDAGEKDGE